MNKLESNLIRISYFPVGVGFADVSNAERTTFLAIATNDSADPEFVLNDSPYTVIKPSPKSCLDWLSVILLSTKSAGVLEFTPPA